MAAGKPVIGSIEGEGKKIIHDAECGFTCAPDQPEVLAALCKKMFDLDDASREAYGKNASNFYQNNFSPKSFVKMFRNIVQELD